MTRDKDDVYGNVTFSVNVPSNSAAAKPASVSSAPIAPNAYNIYPNSVYNKLTVVALNHETSANNVIITDIMGRIITQEETITFKDNTYEIETGNLSAGLYFIRITDSKGKIHSLKFLKAE